MSSGPGEWIFQLIHTSNRRFPMTKELHPARLPEVSLLFSDPSKAWFGCIAAENTGTSTRKLSVTEFES